MKKVKLFQPKIVIFTAVKNSCMLHGRVFVMFFKLFAIDHFKCNFMSALELENQF